MLIRMWMAVLLLNPDLLSKCTKEDLEYVPTVTELMDLGLHLNIYGAVFTDLVRSRQTICAEDWADEYRKGKKKFLELIQNPALKMLISNILV